MIRNLLVAGFVAFVPLTASAAEVLGDTDLDVITAGVRPPTGDGFLVTATQVGDGTTVVVFTTP